MGENSGIGAKGKGKGQEVTGVATDSCFFLFLILFLLCGEGVRGKG